MYQVVSREWTISDWLSEYLIYLRRGRNEAWLTL